MERFEWKNVVIERHFLVFDGISCDNLSKYEYTVEDLKKDPVIVIKGHELPDFIMSVNSLTEHGISFLLHSLWNHIWIDTGIRQFIHRPQTGKQQGYTQISYV